MGSRPDITPQRRLLAWARLLRLPNLFTVPGDPMAGLALACLANDAQPRPTVFLLAGAAALCFYCFGLILNDLVDCRVDRLQRPERPLPRHEVATGHALLAAGFFLCVGIWLATVLGPAALAMGTLLAFLICSYNLLLKRFRGLGSLNMGLCRGTSFLLAVNLADWTSLVVAAAIGMTAYVAAISWLAQAENGDTEHGGSAWQPLCVLAVLCPAVLALSVDAVQPLALLPVAVLLAGALVAAVRIGARLARGRAPPAVTRAGIGGLIRNLLLLQAAYLLLLPDTLPVGVILVFAWPLSAWLGRHVSPS